MQSEIIHNKLLRYVAQTELDKIIDYFCNNIDNDEMFQNDINYFMKSAYYYTQILDKIDKREQYLKLNKYKK